MNIKNLAYFLISAIAIVIILSFGKGLLIPFVFAVLLWFIIREVRNQLDRIPFFKNKLPSWVKNIMTSLVIISLLSLISRVLTTNINNLAQSYHLYESNIDLLLKQADDTYGIDLRELFGDYLRDFDFGSVLGTVLNSLTSAIGNTFMILIFSLFIFLEESTFPVKLKKIFHREGQFHEAVEIIRKIEDSIAKYLGLKTLVSLITGVLSYLVLLFIGIDSPVFWAFLIFLLNFIPTIGSLIGTLFPAVFCLLQFGEFLPGILVLVLVGMVQVLVGNFLEPKLIGNSMNLSALVTILALSFWGALWGVTGMVLSVPITVMLVIVFSKFERTRPVAILLSEKGNID